MAKHDNRVVIDHEGGLEVEREARMRLRAYAGRYRLVANAPGLVILRRELPGEEGAQDLDELDSLLDFEADEPAAAPPRVLMAGEIVSAMSLFQIIEVIGERGWQGDLHVLTGDDSSFELTFDQGALTHARSNHPEDRLGELLLRENVITRQQLTDMLWEVTAERRLGQVCLDLGVLDRETLFSYLQKQVEAIFHRTLLVPDGGYVFNTPDPARAPADLKVHLPVRALLMIGVQRLDELELYRQLIPGGDVCLEPVIAPDSADLDDAQMVVIAASDGDTTITQIAKESGLGDYATTKAAYHLVKRRIARVRARSRIDEAVVRRVTESFSDIVRDIFLAISAHGDPEPSRRMLEAWITGSGYEGAFGDHVVQDGTIDPTVVLRNLHAARDDDPVAGFHHIAHELVSFALFCAGSALPREDELRLSRQVNRRLQDIRI